jgi:hypothetical protein
LGGALPGDVGEEPGSSEDRDDLDGIVADPVDDAERADNQFTEFRLATLGDNATRFGKLLQALGCADKALYHEIRIKWGVFSDVVVNRLKVPDGPR